MFSNKIYDILKWIAIIVLPALATLVKVVFTIWGIPCGTEIATTITAFATFLGALLMISNANYQKTLDEFEE
jgi:hypothetical protein